MIGTDWKPEDIWDDGTGETFGQALERFKTFGPLLTATEAVDAIVLAGAQGKSITMMSFGYGDDPVNFEEVGLDELLDSLEDDRVDGTPGAIDRYWGPFAVWA